MTPLAENPHVTVYIALNGNVLGVTNNISPDLKVKVCYTEADFMLAKRGDSYNSNPQIAKLNFDPAN